MLVDCAFRSLSSTSLWNDVNDVEPHSLGRRFIVSLTSGFTFVYFSLMVRTLESNFGRIWRTGWTMPCRIAQRSLIISTNGSVGSVSWLLSSQSRSLSAPLTPSLPHLQPLSETEQFLWRFTSGAASYCGNCPSCCVFPWTKGKVLSHA